MDWLRALHDSVRVIRQQEIVFPNPGWAALVSLNPGAMRRQAGLRGGRKAPCQATARPSG